MMTIEQGWARVLRLAAGWPGVGITISDRDPALEVDGQLFARWVAGEHDAILLACPREMGARYVASLSGVSSHPEDAGFISVYPTEVDDAVLAELVDLAWCCTATPGSRRTRYLGLAA